MTVAFLNTIPKENETSLLFDEIIIGEGVVFSMGDSVDELPTFSGRLHVSKDLIGKFFYAAAFDQDIKINEQTALSAPPPIRRSTRLIKPPKKLLDFVLTSKSKSKTEVDTQSEPEVDTQSLVKAKRTEKTKNLQTLTPVHHRSVISSYPSSRINFEALSRLRWLVKCDSIEELTDEHIAPNAATMRISRYLERLWSVNLSGPLVASLISNQEQLVSVLSKIVKKIAPIVGCPLFRNLTDAEALEAFKNFQKLNFDESYQIINLEKEDIIIKFNEFNNESPLDPKKNPLFGACIAGGANRAFAKFIDHFTEKIRLCCEGYSKDLALKVSAVGLWQGESPKELTEQMYMLKILARKIIEHVQGRKRFPAVTFSSSTLNIPQSAFRSTMQLCLKPAQIQKLEIIGCLMRKFNPTNQMWTVADTCLGWGSSLFCAKALKEVGCFIGIDANRNLKPYHDEMERVLPSANPSITIYREYRQLEEVVDDNDFWREKPLIDLLFTSPPYGAHEGKGAEMYAYGTECENLQSYSQYKTASEWKEKFLGKGLAHYAKRINRGGYLAINICNTNPCKDVCDFLVHYIRNHSELNLEYQGAILAKEPLMTSRATSYERTLKEKKPTSWGHPIYIWRKRPF